MQITRNDLDTAAGPSDWFTGDVYVDTITTPSNDWRIGAAAVHFTPSARTAWHAHPHGQTIWVTDGIGLCQREGGPIEIIRARREPLARRSSNPLHDPYRHATGRRARQRRHLGRPRQRRRLCGSARDRRLAAAGASSLAFASGRKPVQTRSRPSIRSESSVQRRCCSTSFGTPPGFVTRSR